MPGAPPNSPCSSSGMNERVPTSYALPPLSHHSGQSTSPRNALKPVYKYIGSVAGVVGTIHDPSGSFPQLLDDHLMLFGDTRAAYLESHGYGTAEVAKLAHAFTGNSFNSASDIPQPLASSINSLEWFWNLK